MKEAVKYFEGTHDFKGFKASGTSSKSSVRTIYKAKVIVSNERLIISDGENQDFIVELQYLENVDIEGNTIDLEMSNCIKISLDC